MIDHPCDSTTPGGVYLCQTDENLSCGACCGLYNVADPGFESLSALLRCRTELFLKTERNFDALVHFKEQVERMENQNRPYPEFHHCPYIGLVGSSLSRPGCLLHPLNPGNRSVDHRGLSDWGGLACATYFCPTCSTLPARYKRILRMCCDSWHLFGLIVPETAMLACFFQAIETLAGQILDPSVLSGHEPFKMAVRRFFALKTDWSYRPKGFNRLGNYFFNDNLYPRIPVNYRGFDCEPSGLDPILTALGSEFTDKSSLESAEQSLHDIITSAAFAMISP